MNVDVEDQWFSDIRVPILAISGDENDNRVIKLHFRRDVTNIDRDNIIAALNLHIEMTATIWNDDLYSDAFRAAKQAYEQKWADINSQSPTEEPDAGLGPLGYAIRAYLAACERKLI